MLEQEISLAPLRKSETQQREPAPMPAPKPRDADTSLTEESALVASLFEKYHEAIFAYLYRLLNDREAAHDLTQETFLQLFRTRDQLPDVKNQRAWIYRIATNAARNAIKRRQRFAWLPWRKVEPSSVSEPDPSHRIGRDLAIEQVLAELPPAYRAPLLLYSHDGFSVREVAQALGLSEGAVKTRLYRAREMFRDLYQEKDL
jgi:RNA polymerase sigma-70 factor (ECF subfamily)